MEAQRGRRKNGRGSLARILYGTLRQRIEPRFRLKIPLGGPALGANPIVGDIFPEGAGDDPGIGIAQSLIEHVHAKHAYETAVTGSLGHAE